MFSDGVIAIIITLMIIEIKVPALDANHIINFIRHIGVYAMSFTVLAIMWLNHHQMFRSIEKINIRIIWLNFLLFFMSLIPLPTQALGANFYAKESHLFYGIILTATAISYSWLQTVINKNSEYMPAANIKAINRLNWLSSAVYALSIPLSFISIYLSLFIFVLIPIIFFIPLIFFIPSRKIAQQL